MVFNAGFAQSFCYDVTTGLVDEIRASLNISFTEFQSLYSAFAIPDIFCALTGGLLISASVVSPYVRAS